MFVIMHQYQVKFAMKHVILKLNKHIKCIIETLSDFLHAVNLWIYMSGYYKKKEKNYNWQVHGA